MKKRIGLLIATLLVASTAAFTACNLAGGNSSSEETSTPTTSSSTVDSSSTQAPGTYTVTFNSDGGSAVASATVNDGDKAQKPTDPTKVGYTFAGWYLGEAAFNFETVAITTDVTLKAKWNVVTYTATVGKAGETGTQVQFTIENRTAKLAEIAAMLPTDTAEFDYEWAEALPTELALNDTQAFTYTETTQKYTVTVRLNNGEDNLVFENVTYGTTLASLFADEDDPTKVGYVPAGIYNGTTPITDLANTLVQGAMTLDVAWAPATDTAYVVRHFQQNVADNEYTEVVADVENKTGTTEDQTAAVAKTYPGFTAKAFNQETIAANGTTVVEIYYDRNTFEVKFVDEDGTPLQSETLKYGAMPVYNRETPTKAATAQYTYTFKGWDYEIVAVTGEKTYTAKFNETVNKYVITFVNENGTTLQSSEVEYGVTPTYDGATPAKEADVQYTYTFAGWDYEIVAVTGEKTYTAKFNETVNKYVITFVDENGTTLQSDEVAYGETPVYTGEVPTKASDEEYTYMFAWTPAVTTVTGAATYTATFTKWLKSTYGEFSQEAFAVMADESTYAESDYGTPTSVTATEDSVTVSTTAGITPDWYGGFTLTEEAIRKLVGLGYTKMLFKFTSDSPYICFWTFDAHTEFVLNISEAAKESGGDIYFASGSIVSLDLEAMTAFIRNGVGLRFVFTASDSWVGYESSEDLKITFSNFLFKKEEKPEVPQDAFAIMANESTYAGHDYGTPTSVTATENTVTVSTTAGITPDWYGGFTLTEEAIRDLVGLGYIKMQFKFTSDSPYICFWTFDAHTEVVLNISEAANVDGGDIYFASGSIVSLDLEAMTAFIRDGIGLKFVFAASDSWVGYESSEDLKITFFDFVFEKKEKPEVPQDAFAVMADESTYVGYSYGVPTSVTATENMVTVSTTAGTEVGWYGGFTLTEEAIRDLVELGYTKMQFTFTSDSPSICFWTFDTHTEFVLNISEAANVSNGDIYFESGSTIVLDLEQMTTFIRDGVGLRFTFTAGNEWVSYESSEDLKITFFDFVFEKQS